MEDLDFDKLENELKEEHGKIFLIFQLNNSLKEKLPQQCDFPDQKNNLW
jgi:hypothetical protein